MSESYRIVTLVNGCAVEGARIDDLALKGIKTTIPAVIVGEEGRGRRRGVIPVDTPPTVPCPNRGQVSWTTSSEVCARCGVTMGEVVDSRRHHPEEGMVRGRLMYAALGKTKSSGRPKFWAMPAATTEDYVIVILRTEPGYRGGSSHTGEHSGWACGSYSCGATGEGEIPNDCPKCNTERASWSSAGPKLSFLPFPGQKLAEGYVAQGTAGRMGGGEQLVVLMPRDVVFRTAYTGRLYGKPASHYYKWDGQQFLAMTWEERSLTDAF